MLIGHQVWVRVEADVHHLLVIGVEYQNHAAAAPPLGDAHSAKHLLGKSAQKIIVALSFY
jgi:dihydroorotase-like cyclic amidohydrolase